MDFMYSAFHKAPSTQSYDRPLICKPVWHIRFAMCCAVYIQHRECRSRWLLCVLGNAQHAYIVLFPCMHRALELLASLLVHFRTSL